MRSDSSTTIRAFIAIHLPPSVQTVLGQTAQHLGGQFPERSVRWVEPHLIHLTLAFLGDTAVSRLPALTQSLDALAAKQSPFRLQLAGVGSFPNRKRPRVIWAGLDGELAVLRTLKSGLDAALLPLGWSPEERPFQAHLTLGRVKDESKAQNVAWQAELPPLEIPVTAVYLVESQLRPSGPVYTTRHTAVFRKS